MEKELPKRKNIRLEEFHYGAGYAYFITICTRDRAQILSKITVGDGALDVPKTNTFPLTNNQHVILSEGRHECRPKSNFCGVNNGAKARAFGRSGIWLQISVAC